MLAVWQNTHISKKSADIRAKFDFELQAYPYKMYDHMEPLQETVRYIYKTAGSNPAAAEV